jgi:hypothetical protein
MTMKRTRSHATALALLCALACGCSGAGGPHIPMGRTPLAEGEPPPWRTDCRREGDPPVKLGYRDAPGGASVLYTTEGDPTYLRARVTEVARYHNGGAPATAMHDLASVPHTAMVEQLEQGIVLTLFATERRHVDALRRQVQQDVWIMRRRGCAAGQEAL